MLIWWVYAVRPSQIGWTKKREMCATHILKNTPVDVTQHAWWMERPYYYILDRPTSQYRTSFVCGYIVPSTTRSRQTLQWMDRFAGGRSFFFLRVTGLRMMASWRVSTVLACSHCFWNESYVLCDTLTGFVLFFLQSLSLFHWLGCRGPAGRKRKESPGCLPHPASHGRPFLFIHCRLLAFRLNSLSKSAGTSRRRA